MRLIDADELKSQIQNAIKKQKGRDCDLVKISELPILIDSQRTVYDADKVVEQLNNNSYEQFGHIKNITTEKAIEIVKAGGVNGR